MKYLNYHIDQNLLKTLSTKSPLQIKKQLPGMVFKKSINSNNLQNEHFKNMPLTKNLLANIPSIWPYQSAQIKKLSTQYQLERSKLIKQGGQSDVSTPLEQKHICLNRDARNKLKQDLKKNQENITTNMYEPKKWNLLNHNNLENIKVDDNTLKILIDRLSQTHQQSQATQTSKQTTKKDLTKIIIPEQIEVANSLYELCLIVCHFGTQLDKGRMVSFIFYNGKVYMDDGKTFQPITSKNKDFTEDKIRKNAIFLVYRFKGPKPWTLKGGINIGPLKSVWK